VRWSTITDGRSRPDLARRAHLDLADLAEALIVAERRAERRESMQE
jgi:hypothetical protein